MSQKPATVSSRRRTREGFTLAELLVSIVVVVIIVLMASQLMTTATSIARNGHKHFDTDTEARVVLDRMALDFAQMVKRTDVDYYVKQRVYKGHGNGHGCGQGHNNDLSSDQIAFYSEVQGYNPAPSTFSSIKQSPISLIAYRVNEGSANNNPAYGRLERMSKGLLWNGVSNNTGNGSYYPIVFQTGQIDNTCTGNTCPCNGTVGPWANVWSGAICNTNNSSDPDYEIIGPDVFRFEYYYLLKNGRVTDWPWDRFDYPTQQTIYSPARLGLSQIKSIAVSIAVIDPKSRALIQQAHSANAAYGDILDVAAELPDFKNNCGRGNAQRVVGTLEADWKTAIESVAQTGQTDQGKLIPPEAAKGIRVYNRYFDLKVW
jgi:prepilin-type N-terminal cleavage/methylation domain-containing protein